MKTRFNKAGQSLTPSQLVTVNKVQLRSLQGREVTGDTIGQVVVSLIDLYALVETLIQEDQD